MATMSNSGATERDVGFTTRPLSWQTGTEILGLDLSRSDGIPEAVIARLWALLCERGILLFRDQFIDHRQHLDFTRRFGPLAETGFLSRYAPEGYPDLFTVTNIRKDGVRSETEVAAAQWHADQSFLARPARGSLLRCVEAPAVGGDTMFANMYQAFETLSEGLRRMLEGQRAFHTLFSSRARVLNGRKPPTEEEMARLGGAMHPVVITHPDTGRKALFISDQVVDHFDGWTVEESKPLLDYLYAHASQPAFTYRHAWRPGDIVFWDNRCTQHYTPVDYDLTNVDAPENRRLMFRSTLA
nr:TauD/TfdA family dioxygenase [Sphingomonas sp. Y57]